MKFTFNGYFWEADVQIPAWSDFYRGDTTTLVFGADDRDNDPMTAEEVALATWVEDNQEKQKRPLLAAVLEAYPDLRSEYLADYDMHEDEEDYLPKISLEDDLAKVMTLDGIYVFENPKDRVPYVGYSFSCRWEEEHGLGVLMHDTRVIEFGGTDRAQLPPERET